MLKRIPFFLAGLFLLPGCPNAACTEIATYSVQLTVLDEAGDPLDTATPTWSVGGGAESPCESTGTGEFVCALETVGTITVKVGAPGYLDQSIEVQVAQDADQCHVVTEVVQVDMITGD